MKKYRVTLQDYTLYMYEIEASSEEEAESIAYTRFNNGDNGQESYGVGTYNIQEIKDK